jgi:hypothetical protein
VFPLLDFHGNRIGTVCTKTRGRAWVLANRLARNWGRPVFMDGQKCDGLVDMRRVYLPRDFRCSEAPPPTPGMDPRYVRRKVHGTAR